MNISIKVDRDFENTMNMLIAKYGENFEFLNGFHETQLNFGDFIDGFVDKRVSDVTIDENANASNKDIRSLLSEKGKSEDKLFAFSKIFYEIKKHYGLKTARDWLETEYNGGFYMHDASTTTYMPYCFSGDTKIITKNGVKTLLELVEKDVEVLNKNNEWERAVVKHFGKQELREITVERDGCSKTFKVTGNHRWFVVTDCAECYDVLSTDELTPGIHIPYTNETLCALSSTADCPDWVVTSVTNTGIVDDVYCAVVDGTESFSLDGGVLTHNCYAYDLSRLAKEGLFFLKNYNNEPPKHLTTFVDDVIEYISFMSNRSSGAVGIPNILIWTYYFWKKDCETNYIIRDPEYYIRQCFQKIIYRLNQPFMRIDQTAFVNVSIFDRNYIESLFGGVQYPDGSYVIDNIEELIEHQKVFMEVVSDIRSENMFTFPVKVIAA